MLVIIVMFVFLQSWRAMLIPAIAVPVVLLGTFAIFYLAGFTHQHADPVRAGAGDRPARRRRDRRRRKCRAADGRKSGHDGARRDDPVDEGIAGRADRDRTGAVGGVPADGLFRRVDRGHLSPVLDHDHLGDGAVGAGRADPQSGADLDPAQAQDAWRNASRRPFRARRAPCSSAPRPASTPASIAPSNAMSAASPRSSIANGCFLGIYVDHPWPCWPSCSCACPAASCPARIRGVSRSSSACPRAPRRRGRSKCATRSRNIC